MAEFVNNDDWLVADQFEPEYTEAELALLDHKREERQDQPADSKRARANSKWWCKCDCCMEMLTENESMCCAEWDQVLPSVTGLSLHTGDPGQPSCVAAGDAFAAMIHPAVVEFFFRLDKVSWKK